MGYVDNNLLPNEHVTYRARLHRIIYLFPVCVLIVALLVALAGGGWIAGGVVGLIGLVLMIPPWIRSSSSEFAVTNKRVLVKVGLMRRHSLELLLQKVEGIGVDQGILGRILGYGTITVSGTGGTREAFRMIAKPWNSAVRCRRASPRDPNRRASRRCDVPLRRRLVGEREREARRSCQGAAAICIPMGRPSAVLPQGMLRAGIPI